MSKKIPVTQRREGYRDTYYRYKLNSPILNPKRNTCPQVSADLQSRTGLERLLKEWDHEENNNGGNNSDTYPGKLQVAKLNLEAAKSEFTELNEQRKAQWQEPLKEIPSDLLYRIDEAEATFDIRVEEVKEIRKRLKAITEKEEQERITKIKNSRPEGAVWLVNGVPHEIDMMKIENGKIIEEPFKGWLVEDYLEKIVRPARAKLLKKLKTKEVKLIQVYAKR